jgi:hypothetical protein
MSITSKVLLMMALIACFVVPHLAIAEGVPGVATDQPEAAYIWRDLRSKLDSPMDHWDFSCSIFSSMFEEPEPVPPPLYRRSLRTVISQQSSMAYSSFSGQQSYF